MLFSQKEALVVIYYMHIKTMNIVMKYFILKNNPIDMWVCDLMSLIVIL